MNDLAITLLLVGALFAILGSGVWIGLTLSGVAWIGMQLFSSRPAGDAMAVTIWGSSSSWTLTALPLFVWMGEILFRTRLSPGHVPRPRPVDAGPAGPPPAHQRHRLHDLRRDLRLVARRPAPRSARCRLPGTAASAATPRCMIAWHARRRSGTLGLLIPPSLIMIVYGVADQRVDRPAFHRRRSFRDWRSPALIFIGLGRRSGRCFNAGQDPAGRCCA